MREGACGVERRESYGGRKRASCTMKDGIGSSEIEIPEITSFASAALSLGDGNVLFDEEPRPWDTLLPTFGFEGSDIRSSIWPDYVFDPMTSFAFCALSRPGCTAR